MGMAMAMAMDMGNLPKRPLMLSEDRHIPMRFAFCSCLAVPPAFFFSTVAYAETPHFVTSLTVGETFTDNAQATKNGRSDWITEISPSISIRRDRDGVRAAGARGEQALVVPIALGPGGHDP